MGGADEEEIEFDQSVDDILKGLEGLKLDGSSSGGGDGLALFHLVDAQLI